MTAIEFNHVSKQYRLGLVSTGTICHDLNRFWQTKILRREDPYLKIGETNDRASKGSSEYVWALKDIDFKVEQGDVVGIIGRNGAGKSTLLKLLSRVTSPTTGTIRARGRIASLLEVGTGFHPEMTGRENIYMNGSIMGMTKAEITRKLDEIVDFSGCERYIDTPVKRYSSGMAVRLGFAIAAHLDPEILVVDEVLAVGDAEFQKKAIGKMQDVASGEGRTVLFVSHNMGAVRRLCKSGILLSNGQIEFCGTADECVDKYIGSNITEFVSYTKVDAGMHNKGASQEVSFEEIRMLNPNPAELASDEPIELEFTMRRKFGKSKKFNFRIGVFDEADRGLLSFVTQFVEVPADREVFKVRVSLRNHGLTQRKYKLTFIAGRWDLGVDVQTFDCVENKSAITFAVKYVDSKTKNEYANGNWSPSWIPLIQQGENATAKIVME